MRSSILRLILPAIVIVIVVGVAVILLTQGSAAPACSAFVVTADAPLTLEDGTRVIVLDDAAELRFERTAIGQADLSDEAHAQTLAAVNAMPVNLRVQGSIQAFTRCRDVAIPIHLESPAPDASLDAYAWDGAQWAWLAGAAQQLSVDLPNLPQYLAWVETLPTAPIIGAEPDPRTGGLDPQYNGIITEIYAPGLNVAANGSVTGQVPAAPPEGAPYVVYPVIRNLTADDQPDAASAQAMLGDEAARKNHVQTVVSIATGSNFAGIAIDFRGGISSDAFTSFVEELAVALHAEDKLLAVTLPLPGPEWQTPFDWYRIGQTVDVVQVDLPASTSFYQPTETAASLLQSISTRIDRNKLQPILSAASIRQADGSPSSLSFSEATSSLFDTASATISTTVGTTLTLSTSPSAALSYNASVGVYEKADNNVHTAATLAVKLSALSGLGLRGAVIRDVQGADVAPNLLEPIKAYRQQSTITGSSELNVQWTITASDGAVVLNETRPLANADLTWTPDRDGTYTVKAAIATVEREVAQVTVGAGEAEATDAGGGAADTCFDASYVADVTVADNTRFDKNKDFTKTWKVRNSGSCAWEADTEIAFVSGAQLGASSPVKVGALAGGQSVDVSVPMNSGDKDGAYTGIWRLRNKDGAFGDQLSVVIKVGAEVAAPAPVAPPAGGGPIAYGIHAHFYGYVDAESGAASITSYTNELGLGWVKIQFRWGDYDYYCGGPDFDVLNAMINRANAQGLKVLLSIVTSPPCTHPWTNDVHAPPDDLNRLAGLMGWLVDNFGGRIHGIEVWNEQNIDREWKTSPQVLDANRYTQMLATAYNVIKAKDPNILVVSGALAPTGFNNGVTATDDFTYLQQMVDAGATQYMDCVGTHVNALRVPPSAGLGGEYDSLFNPPHHSWYFKDTVQGYQSITGKPACVTEFGVATQEGVGSVSGFEWAANNTQQNQADWVTQGMSLCKQWGCRLMILWNLDYGPATGAVNDNALYSFLDMGWGKRPVFSAVKNWCAANGCR